MINYYSNLFLMNTFLYFRYGNRILYFLFFLIWSKSTNIETEYKFGQYCTSLSQSDCKYFFVLAIIYSKKCPKSKCICFNEVIRLMTIKIKVTMKSRIYIYNINWSRPWHGHKHTKCKMCLSIMMVIRIKQHLSNIWSSMHEEVKQHWDWV